MTRHDLLHLIVPAGDIRRARANSLQISAERIIVPPSPLKRRLQPVTFLDPEDFARRRG
jgi:hypothetical protein